MDNQLIELLDEEKPIIPDSNADYYIGYNNGLVMAQAIALKLDAVPVVRCKDCQFYLSKGKNYWCDIFDNITPEYHFCSYGERREKE